MGYKFKQPRAPLIRALEPRLLFDGAAAGTAMDTATDQTLPDDLAGDAGQHDATTAESAAQPQSSMARALEASQNARAAEATAAPQVERTATSPITVREDISGPVNGLRVTGDADTNYSLTLGVGNGTLTFGDNVPGTVTGNGSGSVTIDGTTAEINTALGSLNYQGNQDFNGVDNLTAGNQSFDITVTAVNDVPSVQPNTTLNVDEGDSSSFSLSDFGITDPDLNEDINASPQTPAQEVIRITELPEQGQLTLDGNPVIVGSTFSMDQIGSLSYTHDGSDVQAGASDGFSVVVNDGGAISEETRIGIDLNSVNQAPELSGNLNPQVFEGQGAEPNEDNTTGIALGLGYADFDGVDTVDNAMFTIDNLALQGQGRLYFANGDEVIAGEQYAAARLADLRFDHNGDEPSDVAPQFDITVTDSGGDTGTPRSITETVTLDVIPNDDDPVLDANTGTSVDAGSIVTLTPGMLSSSDIDNNELFYAITARPESGELQFQDGGAWRTLGVGATITQADINSGRIRYVQSVNVGEDTVDGFDFQVYDGELKAFNAPGDPGVVRDDNGDIATNRFSIAINGANMDGKGAPDAADDGYDGDLDVFSQTNMGFSDVPSEGDGQPDGDDTRLLTAENLEYVLAAGSRSIDAAQTFYRLTSLPSNGILQKGDGDGNWRTLRGYESFTQSDIDEGRVRYVHDGSENHQSSFGFSVSGGTAEVESGTFDISVLPTNDRPTAIGGTTKPFGEGGTIRLGSDLIGMADADTANEDGEPDGKATEDDLFFRVTTQPEHGTLQRWDGSNWVDIAFDEAGNSVWLSQALLDANVDGGTSGIRYIHDGSENFSDQFTFDVRDDLSADDANEFRADPLPDDADLPAYQRALSDAATVSLSVSPINDAPITPQGPDGDDVTIVDQNGEEQTTANEILNLAEGATATITADMLNTVDPDSVDAVLQYRLATNVEHGTLMLNGLALGLGSRFTQADINAGRVTYQHDGSEDFADAFDFIVSDSVDNHGYTEGVSDSGASTFQIVVDSARNDTPEIINNGASTVDLFGDANGSNYTHNFGDAFTIADSDIDDDNIDSDAGEQDFIQARLAFRDADGNLADVTADGGSIVFGNTSGLTLVDDDASDGTLVIQGSYADVQAALTNLRVTVPNTDYNDTYSLDVSVDDRLRNEAGAFIGGANGNANPPTNDSGEPLNEDGSVINETNNVSTTSVAFRVSDDNDDPSITAPPEVNVDEDTVLRFTGEDQLTIEDSDAFDSELTVSLTVGERGHLSIGTDATTSDANTLTLTGTLSELNAQLAGLTYIADGNYHGADNLTVTVNDGGSNGSGGGEDITQGIPIAIAPVNDGPNVVVPGTQTLDDGTTVTFSDSNGNAISVDDLADYEYLADADGETVNDRMQVTLEAALEDGATGTLGNFTLGNTAGITFVEGTDGGSSRLVIQGTRTDLNAALEGLVYDLGDSNNSDRTDNITVTLNDMANGGSQIGGPGNAGAEDALPATAMFSVQISGENDGPAVQLNPDGNDNPQPYTVEEDSYANRLSGISITDPDDFGADMQVTVSVGYGTLAVGAVDGLEVRPSDGNRTLTLIGSESRLNAALAGLAYTPDADFHTQDVTGDTLTVTIDDQGNTGTGGSLTATAQTAIAVTPVNDRPVASGGPDSLDAVNEDTNGGDGQTLADLLSDNYDDSTDDQRDRVLDGDTQGDGGNTASELSHVAIVGNDASVKQGVWQVSDGQGGWVDVPAGGLSVGSALVVTADTNIRFNPADDFFGEPGALDVRLADGDASQSIASGVQNGSATLSDLSTNGGTGETGRWSAEAVGLNITVSNVNDRPVGENASLEAINEGNLDAAGNTVENLFGGVYSDATDDQTALGGGGDATTDFGGIAIVGNAATSDQGTWQYSTDDGANWTDLATNLADDNATTLAGDSRLRFVPVNGDYNDESGQGAPGSLTVRLADSEQVATNGQDISNNLSETDTWSESVTLSTSVNPINDAPSAQINGDYQDISLTEGDTFDETGFMVNHQPDANVENGAFDENDQTLSFSVDGIATDGTYTIEELFGDNQPQFVDGANSGADNRLTFTPTDILAEGETQTVTVTVGVTDDGGTANGGNDTGESRIFTITVTGTNDVP
ncbi:cadherin-like domain-containing protein, partial [Halomonas cupida]|uniref:cadherin-like domain-containing protein n=1 Tax=Halomonas cupida TaxID=44933 RepID=UPI003EF30C2A